MAKLIVISTHWNSSYPLPNHLDLSSSRIFSLGNKNSIWYLSAIITFQDVLLMSPCAYLLFSRISVFLQHGPEGKGQQVWSLYSSFLKPVTSEVSKEVGKIYLAKLYFLNYLLRLGSINGRMLKRKKSVWECCLD